MPSFLGTRNGACSTSQVPSLIQFGGGGGGQNRIFTARAPLDEGFTLTQTQAATESMGLTIWPACAMDRRTMCGSSPPQ